VAADQCSVTEAQVRSSAVNPAGALGGWVSALGRAAEAPDAGTPTSTAHEAAVARSLRGDNI
jgi:hypothetical protein